MKIYFKIIIFLCLFLTSCNKEEFTKGHSILEIASTKPAEMQELVKARLLLAKIISIAFSHKDFRTYFKNHFGSKSKEGNYFEECLLIKHLDDKVLQDGTSLKDFLNSINDCEVSDILSDKILDYVLSVDQMVTIKLPDIFLNFTWDIDKIRPVVIATYPELYSNANFIGYHHNNDSEYYSTGDIPQVFHVYIKRSEDHAVISKSNISEIFEYLPQIEACDKILAIITNEVHTFNDIDVVNLKNLFKIWSDKCAFKDDYIEIGGCTESCNRFCSIPINNNIVLDHLSITEPVFYLTNSNMAFRESGSFYFQAKDIPKNIDFVDFAIPNVRFSESGRSFNVLSKTSKLNKVPTMTIIENFEPNEQNIESKFLISNLPDINLYYSVTFLQYGDIYYKRSELNPNFHNSFSPENAWLTGSNVLDFCFQSNVNVNISGEVKLNFRY